MVGLQRAVRDHRVRALRARLADEELEFARFVAAGGEAGAVVAFEPQIRAAEMRA